MDTLDTLAERIARNTPSDGTFETPLPGVKLIRSATPTLPMPVIYEPTVCIVAQGRKRAMLGPVAYVYDPAQFLIASVGLPVMGSVIEASAARPYLSVQIDLDMQALGELILRHPAAKPGLDAAAGLTLNQTTPQLIDAASRLIGLLDAPEDLDALGPLTLREILYRLLTGPGGDVIRQMATADSRLSQIARAILWIRAHFREPCRIEEAAGVAGMSRSTFHLHFKAVTAMSPIEYRTQLRLQEARRLMVTDALDAASAGFTVGYESSSHFSRDYSRIFGRPPATDAGRLRAGTTGVASLEMAP